MKYDIKINGIETHKYTHIFWGCKGIGFGELTVTKDTHEIVDSECMSDEFCKQVMELAFKGVERKWMIYIK